MKPSAPLPSAPSRPTPRELPTTSTTTLSTPLSAPLSATLTTLSMLTIALAVVLGNCGTHDSYVKSDDAALGRVVVYRNGIAYFERRARTTGNRLALTVPEDKVNDFLKSLTVVDAKTGETLPVSFPTQRKHAHGKVEMAIQLPDARPRDLVLSYITDAPAWKSSYRVVVGADGKVQLQGWAVVDNTSGEDWRAVKIGVGSSSALSFRYDLRSVRRVHREMLHNRMRLAVAPPHGGGVHRADKAAESVVDDVADADIPRPVGHPEREVAAAEKVAATRGGGGSWWPFGGKKDETAKQPPSAAAAEVDKRKARYQAARQQWRQRQQLADQRLGKLAQRLNRSQGSITIEGYSQKGERAPQDRALDRANTYRNALIRAGVAPARIKVAARGVVAGRSAGVRLVTDAATETKAQVAQSDEPVGESHFESALPMTVAKGTSAMVSVVRKGTSGQIVYLYEPDGTRGNRRFAFKAVRFKNPTDSTLETGPMTVYGAGRFIGEGMTSAIAPSSTAIVPFAMDRQVRVERSDKQIDRLDKLLNVRRGVLRAEVRHTRRTRFAIQNRSSRPADLYIRHNVRKGWRLDKSPKVFEHIGESHLFAIKVPAHTSKELVLDESTPLQRTVDLRSTVGVELMRRYLAESQRTDTFARDLGGVLGEHRRIGHLTESIEHLRQRNIEYRARMDELHDQIISLKLVRAGGTLMRHLQRKMKETSDAVQRTTMDVVNHKEQLMLSRIKFHDGISELALPVQRTAAKNRDHGAS